MFSIQSALVVLLVIVLIAVIVMMGVKTVIEDYSATDFTGIWKVVAATPPGADGTAPASSMQMMNEIASDTYVDCSQNIYKFVTKTDGSGTGTMSLGSTTNPGTAGARLYNGTVSLVNSIKTIHWTPVATPPSGMTLPPLVYTRMQ